MNTIVRTVAILGRREDMSFEEFCRYWREVHGPLAAQLPGLVRYVQRHVKEPSTEFGIDGFALLDYESAEAMEAAWASEAGQRALADVPNFLSRHDVVIVEDHVLVDSESQ